MGLCGGELSLLHWLLFMGRPICCGITGSELWKGREETEQTVSPSVYLLSTLAALVM